MGGESLDFDELDAALDGLSPEQQTQSQAEQKGEVDAAAGQNAPAETPPAAPPGAPASGPPPLSPPPVRPRRTTGSHGPITGIASMPTTARPTHTGMRRLAKIR
jgi:hypothetical protein